MQDVAFPFCFLVIDLSCCMKRRGFAFLKNCVSWLHFMGGGGYGIERMDATKGLQLWGMKMQPCLP